MTNSVKQLVEAAKRCADLLSSSGSSGFAAYLRKAARAVESEGDGWIEIKEGCEMPAADVELWCWVVPRESFYFDVPGYEHQTTPGIWEPHAKVIRTFRTREGDVRFNCGCGETVTYYRLLPAPPT